MSRDTRPPADRRHPADGPIPFGVQTELMALSVSIRDGVVVRIGLRERVARPPRTALERRVARELCEYACGRLREFSFPRATSGSPFEERVWREVSRIPYGSTVTYGAIAKRLGQPGAARAVGTANGRNPLPLVIPCHRVVAAGGGLGGYGGGLDLKRRLLTLEERVAGVRLGAESEGS
jgi:methylated-DNA-[protein]-cysteine S-methyltransferase